VVPPGGAAAQRLAVADAVRGVGEGWMEAAVTGGGFQQASLLARGPGRTSATAPQQQQRPAAGWLPPGRCCTPHGDTHRPAAARVLLLPAGGHAHPARPAFLPHSCGWTPVAPAWRSCCEGPRSGRACPPMISEPWSMRWAAERARAARGWGTKSVSSLPARVCVWRSAK
jgi:hypothetical protein